MKEQLEKKIQLDKKIQEYELKLRVLKVRRNVEEKSPIYGTKYYYIDRFGEVYEGFWSGVDKDMACFTLGNYYESRYLASNAVIEKMFYNFVKLNDGHIGRSDVLGRDNVYALFYNENIGYFIQKLSARNVKYNTIWFDDGKWQNIPSLLSVCFDGDAMMFVPNCEEVNE